MLIIWFAVEVCIDFALVCRVSMFAADCATYGGVWGGQGGWLGLIVKLLIIKLPTWLAGHKFRKPEWRNGDAFEPMLIVYKQVCACVQANVYMCTTPSAYMCKRVYVQFWACT